MRFTNEIAELTIRHLNFQYSLHIQFVFLRLMITKIFNFKIIKILFPGNLQTLQLYNAIIQLWSIRNNFVTHELYFVLVHNIFVEMCCLIVI